MKLMNKFEGISKNKIRDKLEYGTEVKCKKLERR